LESAEDADNASTAGDEIAQTQDATSPVSQASSYRTGDANPGTIVISRHSQTPVKKAKKRHVDETASALRAANEVMSTVSKRLADCKTEPGNATRAFCDMLYHRLMAIPNEEDREALQFELHSVLMRYKRQQRLEASASTPTSTCSSATIQRRPTSMLQLLEFSHTADEAHDQSSAHVMGSALAGVCEPNLSGHEDSSLQYFSL